MTRNPARGGKVYPDREGLGRSKGGVNTKIHVAADLKCWPVARVITPGQRHDSLAVEAVMDDINIGRARPRLGRVLAD